MVMERSSRGRRLPVAMTATALLFITGIGCGPSLSDRPTDFRGDGAVEVAIICGDTKVGSTQRDAAWIKTAVRGYHGTTVDWPGVRLTTRGVKVVRRAAGRVIDIPGGKKQRTVTYWAVSTAPKGSSAALGPIEVRYKRGGGGEQSFSLGECPLTVK